MLDSLYAFFYEQPARITAAGGALLWLARLQFIAGIAVLGLTKLRSSVRFLGPHPPAHHFTAEQLFPGIPTFWVPESFLGFLVVALVAVWGLMLFTHGRQVERLCR